ncbi:MAG: heme ABC transporter permease CcmC [Pseudomonadota bacterium]
MSIWRYANPAEFMGLTGRLLLPVWLLTAILLLPALFWGLVMTPNADLFGSSVKILFVHVPTALIAINTYVLMAIASAIAIVRRHHVSFLVAKAAAPIGAAFTVVAIVTGAIWGQPTWGAWWVWDARLTSILILFFFYLGYMALWAAIEDPEKAGDLTSVLCLVGVVFALLSRYAFLFWETQHQGSSLSVSEGQRVADVYRTPLYLCMAGFYLLFIGMLLVRARTEIRLRRSRALRLRSEAMA